MLLIRKNRMENNILHADSYRSAYHEIIGKLNADSKKDFNERLKKIEKPKISTCMQFADWIQTIIDYIVFFAYADKDCIDKNKLIEDLKKQKRSFEGIGSEIDVLLKENVKMISCVLNYQSNRINNKYEYSTFENIRGDMLGIVPELFIMIILDLIIVVERQRLCIGK